MNLSRRPDAMWGGVRGTPLVHSAPRRAPGGHLNTHVALQSPSVVVSRRCHPDWLVNEHECDETKVRPELESVPEICQPQMKVSNSYGGCCGTMRSHVCI
ncbi:hypothetical protein DPEC_G00083360 [Dallia pectoralis]|uniref:Uncharacterized protein n=1 Tax=Dallia pectoralis TaxID=75939 RepID=A0ACC2GZ73_DALPE|nr:hypothetical protein DPEC_G00083360 [Dallia pectoralis]